MAAKLKNNGDICKRTETGINHDKTAIYLLQEVIYIYVPVKTNKNGITIYPGETTETNNFVPDPMTLPRNRLS